MFDSAKFLLPSVTAGLPAPAVELALVVAVVPLLDFELPHAARSTPASRIPTTAKTPLSFTDLPCAIRCLLFWCRLKLGTCRHRRRFADRAAVAAVPAQPHSARSERVLEQGERGLHGERQQRHADRRPQHAREVVARLV